MLSLTLLQENSSNEISFQVLRWRPVAAGGIPHVVTQDDIYEGYLIPKGTMLFANTYAIHHDPNEYENPSEFIPERFVNNKFGIKSENLLHENDGRRVTYGFGAGRRICPGQRLSENSLVSINYLTFHDCPLSYEKDSTKVIQR